MIERNIGKTERVVRFILAALLVAWIIGSESFGIAQGVGLLAAFALLWNSIFARCYLWKWLGLSTCDPETEDCTPPEGGTGASEA